MIKLNESLKNTFDLSTFSNIVTRQKQIKNPLQLKDSFQINEEVHLSAACYMSDEEIMVFGGWNSKNLCFIDTQKENYFQQIMNFSSQNTFNISNLKYVEKLRFLLVGDCFSDLCIYRLIN
jgi:hypothetical protein